MVSAMARSLPEANSIRVASLPEAGRLAVESDEPIIINTTPLGMMGVNVQASPWPDGALLPQEGFVYDLVYNPARTRFMEQAEAAGCRSSRP